MVENDNSIYSKCTAVKCLNQIDGFNPLEFMRTITDISGDKPKWYLDVKYRILWFRLANPLGKIDTIIREITENMAIVEAKIYLDYKDEVDKYLSKATSLKTATPGEESYSYLEWAETAAIGRALTNAGYGIQFCDMLEGNDIEPTESGVDADKVGKAITVEDVMKELSIEECEKIVIPFGRNAGKTIGEVFKNNKSDLNWIVDNYNGNNYTLKAAASIMLNSELPQVV